MSAKTDEAIADIGLITLFGVRTTSVSVSRSWATVTTASLDYQSRVGTTLVTL